MSSAFLYALAAAFSNILGALAVTLRSLTSLKVIEGFVAFGAGFMLSVALIEIVPASFERSGSNAAGLILLGYLLVHFTQHTWTEHFHFGEETHDVTAVASTSAVVGLLLHTFFDGVAIASGFLVRPSLGFLIFVAIFLHKLPEGVTIASLVIASGQSQRRAVGSAALVGVATIVGVAVTEHVTVLVRHGLALSGGVTLYVAASNLVPEFQSKPGWRLPLAFFAGAAAFFGSKELLKLAGF